jgi:hypothetical protein
MIDDMLNALSQRLHLDGQERELVLRELQSHLEESQRYLEACGCSPEEARRESIERFGDPLEVADMLSDVHRHRPSRFRLLMAATFAIAALMAAFGAGGTLASTTGNHPTHHTKSLVQHTQRATHHRPLHG